ncbi:MAG: DUF898 family protein [Alphaproteobacteria bacterium]|nr:MAG: DUF898 family protein [Alphaproteobacteria bacterium]
MQQQRNVSQNNLLQYCGTKGEIYKVWIKNLLLMIVTLLVYRAWAKTRMRKYIWSHYVIAGDPLRYTGTGGEIFKGYVIAALIYGLLSGIPYIIAMISNSETVTHSFYLNYVWLLLFFIARYSGLRYRLGRTTWRGIRLRLTGDAYKYASVAIRRMFANIFTLGFAIPKSDIKKHSYIMNHLFLGNQAAVFVEDISGLKKTNIITGLLAAPTLFISRFWYRAALANKKLENLSLGNIRFHGAYTGGAYAKLFFGNIGLFIITLGLGLPLIVHRMMVFHARNVSIVGTLEDVAILQQQSQLSGIGEGLSDQFDTGMDVDLGFI